MQDKPTPTAPIKKADAANQLCVSNPNPVTTRVLQAGCLDQDHVPLPQVM